MAKETIRLDLLVVERGLLPSRQAAQAAIMDGGVLVDGEKITKPGMAVQRQAQLQITSQWQTSKYVGRGGFKLERALDEFQVDVSERICLDIGASTGGFTDCLLQRGAQLVYAIDVGFGQLVGKLRQDARVIVKERTNARNLSPDQLYASGAERADLAVLDVAFISLTKVLPGCLGLLQPQCDLIALIKPQFEAGKSQVKKGGVVRDPAVHQKVLDETIAAAAALSLQTMALTYSPVKGPAGNIEFLVHWRKPLAVSQYDDKTAVDVQQIVRQAHEILD